jgi:hypothetical protein
MTQKLNGTHIRFVQVGSSDSAKMSQFSLSQGKAFKSNPYMVIFLNNSVPQPLRRLRRRRLLPLQLAKLIELFNKSASSPPVLRASSDCVLSPDRRTAAHRCVAYGGCQRSAACHLTAMAMSARHRRLRLRRIIGSAFAPTRAEKQTELQQRQCCRLAVFFRIFSLLIEHSSRIMNAMCAHALWK